jgi:hypothetical protein
MDGNSNEPKLCINCKHHKLIKYPRARNEISTCTNKLIPNPVNRSNVYCIIQRSDSGYCKNAIYFESVSSDAK